MCSGTSSSCVTSATTEASGCQERRSRGGVRKDGQQGRAGQMEGQGIPGQIGFGKFSGVAVAVTVRYPLTPTYMYVTLA